MTHQNNNLSLERPLFLLAHPDDETMLGAAMLEHGNAQVMVATDGEASTLNFSRNRLCRR